MLLLLQALWSCQAATRWDPNSPVTQINDRVAVGATAGTLASVGFYNSCMATVIDPLRALTAAHCVQGQNPAAASFLLGGDIGIPQISLPVLSFTVHPQYAGTAAHDLAILNLGVSAPVPPAAVLDHLTPDAVGNPLVVAGFGASLGGSRNQSGVLQTLTSDLQALTDRVITLDNANAPCFGANGAPLFLTDVENNLLLVGIASYTTTADCSGLTGATRLDTEAAFLQVTPATAAQTAPAAPPDAAATPTANTGCGKETARGRCRGDVVIFCANNTVTQRNCSALNAHCAWSYVGQNFACAAAADPIASGPCAGASFNGRCDGQFSVWCYNNTKLIRDDCAAAHKLCGYNARLGYYDCLAALTVH
jgi:hypothetical protein